MPDPPPLSSAAAARIDDLRRRWNAAPASRLFLQLAEEYRKSGRAREAVDILRNGLKGQPNYVSAQIALGRSLFEAGDFDEAEQLMQKVLKGDPESLIANRVLGDIGVLRGDKVEAIKRFKLLRVLNPGDEEVQQLVLELDGQLAAERSSAAVPPPPAAGVTTGVVVRPSELRAVPDRVDFAEAPVAVPDAPVGIAAEPPPPVESPEPLALAAREPAPESTETLFDSSPLPEPSSAPVAPDLPTPSSSTEDSVFDDTRAGRWEAIGRARETAPEDPFPQGDLAAAPEGLEPGPGPAESVGDASGPLPTLTMASLYLAQGHSDDARAIAERLLEEDPDDSAAAGLRDRALAAALPAALPVSAAVASAAVAPASLAEAKAQRLRGWLAAVKPESRQ